MDLKDGEGVSDLGDGDAQLVTDRRPRRWPRAARSAAAAAAPGMASRTAGGITEQGWCAPLPPDPRLPLQQLHV
jgi:hypothetical protein